VKSEQDPPITRHELAKMIDHSLLKPTVTRLDTLDGIALALSYDVAAVTVKPCYVALAAQEVEGSQVLVDTVLSFPHGDEPTDLKAQVAGALVERGANEIDMVLNIGALLGGEESFVRADIAAVVTASAGAKVKVILEVAYLNKDQIVRACELSEEAGAHFVKTSTGFAPSGYTQEILELMRASVSDRVEVKAAHGVRSLDSALEVRRAGASRFGATQTAKIMAEWDARYATQVAALEGQ
jgi:deoxyribose-phosphate aldolase